ncbi:MAG: hypothetical protein LLF94_06925 [Chlamydiales bacterium]|nr:hypothetical protein [Chlamydiales bacterium]
MSNRKIAIWFLRVGLAFVFAYASYEICVNPENFLKYTPSFIFNFIPEKLFLYSFGVAEVALAAWLLTGWKAYYSSIISVMLMVGIIAFNPEHFQILFRNVAIGFGGLALLMLERSVSKQLKSNSSTYVTT